MTIKYNVIKVSDLELHLLETSKKEICKSKGYDCFDGVDHKDLKDFGQIEHIKTCPSSTYGYERTKDGVPYWVLPYPSNPILDIDRKEGDEIICYSLTLEQLDNFGFDVEEI